MPMLFFLPAPCSINSAHSFFVFANVFFKSSDDVRGGFFESFVRAVEIERFPVVTAPDELIGLCVNDVQDERRNVIRHIENFRAAAPAAAPENEAATVISESGEIIAVNFRLQIFLRAEMIANRINTDKIKEKSVFTRVYLWFHFLNINLLRQKEQKE